MEEFSDNYDRLDEDLIARVRAKAGGLIHDAEAGVGIYQWSFKLMERFRDTGDELNFRKWKVKLEQYGRSCRSFLVTGDMLESCNMVREAMEREGKL
jgi:hypothetical protein